jgi:hypothetical protein
MDKLLSIGIVAVCAACAPSSSNPDATPTDATPTAADAAPPYRHSIIVDGNNDFTVAETFSTTSPTYATYITWDESSVYLGFSGDDVATDAPDSATKWVFAYFDVDPGQGTGAYLGEQYNTQRPGFPSSFASEYYLRWKSDGSLADLQSFAGSSSWNVEPTTIAPQLSGSFVEVAIPRAELGDPALLGVVTFMMNEKPMGEWSYAGLYPGSFTDGYYDAEVAGIPLSRYLNIDFASSRLPNDPGAEKP